MSLATETVGEAILIGMRRSSCLFRKDGGSVLRIMKLNGEVLANVAHPAKLREMSRPSPREPL